MRTSTELRQAVGVSNAAGVGIHDHLPEGGTVAHVPERARPAFGSGRAVTWGISPSHPGAPISQKNQKPGLLEKAPKLLNVDSQKKISGRVDMAPLVASAVCSSALGRTHSD